MKTSNLLPVAVAVLLLGPQRGFAEGNPSQAAQDSLTEASDALFAAHREEFVIVDALRDGYLQYDQPYTISYDPAGVSINGQALPDSALQRYLQRIRDYKLFTGADPKTYYAGTMRGPGYNRETILDTGSAFRKLPSQFIESAKLAADEKMKSAIVSEMLRDGILASADTYDIQYDNAALTVNAKTLEGSMNEKYRLLYRMMLGIDPKPGERPYTFRKHVSPR